MGKIFLIADLHAYHRNIISFCSRPFKDVDSMNSAMIQRWNETVNKDDTVYVLGDLSFGRKQQTIDFTRSLHGNKHLVYGNHDTFSPSVYYECGFQTVSMLPVILSEFFILSHEPMFITPDSIFANIFGHVHNNPAYHSVTARSFCVSVERIDYRPIELEEIRKQMAKYWGIED